MSLGGEIGFAEPTNGLAVVGPRLGANRRTTLVAVTHRDKTRFSCVHAYRRPLVGGRLRLVLHIAGNGDVEIPRSVPLEQPTFTHLGVVCVQRFKPIPIPPGHSKGPVTVRSQQEPVCKRSRDLHRLSNEHELINLKQSIGNADSGDCDSEVEAASAAGDITDREHGFLDTGYRALNGQFDNINYDITSSMTKIKGREEVVASLQKKNILTTIDAGDNEDDEEGDSEAAGNGGGETNNDGDSAGEGHDERSNEAGDGNEQDADSNEDDEGDAEPEREVKDSNAETIKVGRTQKTYYRPHDDAGPLVDSSFNDKIGENGEESLSHRPGVLLIGKYYQQQGYDVTFYEDDDFTEAVFDVSVEPTEESSSDVGRVVEVETTPEHQSHVASDYTHLASSIKESVWVVEDRGSAYRLVRSVQEKLDSSPNKDNSLEDINNQVNAPGLSKIFTLTELLEELG